MRANNVLLAKGTVRLCTSLHLFARLVLNAHLNHLCLDRLAHMVVPAGVRDKEVCQLGQPCSASQLVQEAHIAGIVGHAGNVAWQQHGLLDV